MTTKPHTSGYDEYLETLVRFKELDKPARVSDLASELKVSKASVSSMLQKLSKQGFVSYSTYTIPKLTPKGETAGRILLKKHRIIHRWLEFLGVRKDKIHDEACVLEHVLSDDIEKKIEQQISKYHLVRLTHIQEGAKCRIVKIEADKKTSERLLDMGLTNGTVILLRNIAPLKGPFELSVRGTRLAISRKLASRVLVRCVK